MADVIVIGAGPAGAAAAKTLADGGARVLLAEKLKLPRNKSCSGILIKKTLDVIDELIGAPVPPGACCTPVDNRGMVFYNDAGRAYRFAQPGRNIWRSAFDHWLTEQAAAAGAEVRDETYAVSLIEDGGRVHVQFGGRRPHCESASCVIVCEGAAGSLYRKLVRPRAHVVTYQTFHSGASALDPHFFHAFLQRDFSQYDAWLNVKDGAVVTGVAVTDPARAEGYHTAFHAYLRREHGLRAGPAERAERWIMPVIEPGCPVHWGGGRVLFAGECAGLLNPMGEGISSAMLSGQAAARAWLEAGGGAPALLPLYRECAQHLQDYMRRQWAFVAGISPSFAHMR